MSLSMLAEGLRRERVSPFLVLGDPSPGLSPRLARAAVDAGAGMLELGFPYTDPVADGPAIQAADVRALAAGTSTSQAIEILAEIRTACPATPLNLLIYGNLVHARGFEAFCREVCEAGASSLLVPDICLEESETLWRSCRKAGLGHVQLVGPLTSEERLARIDERADAFLYLVARQGVTGVRDDDFEAVETLVRRVVHRTTNPLCLGFGLSGRDQVRRAFAAGARVAVIGSHLARLIEAEWERSNRDEDRLVAAFAEAVRDLIPEESAREAEGGDGC